MAGFLEYLKLIFFKSDVEVSDSGELLKVRKSAVNLAIPEGVKSVDSFAFEECKKLKSVIFPRSLKKVTLGGGHDAENLESVTFSECTEEIESHAFYSCEHLTEVTIPVSVKKIGSNAFGREMAAIHYRGTEEQWDAIDKITVSSSPSKSRPQFFESIVSHHLLEERDTNPLVYFRGSKEEWDSIDNTAIAQKVIDLEEEFIQKARSKGMEDDQFLPHHYIAAVFKLPENCKLDFNYKD